MAQVKSQFEGFRKYQVGGWEYAVTYFEAQFKNNGTAVLVADQFTRFVEGWGAQGFEFLRCDEVPYRITPGCLQGLFGAKESFGHCTVVTFRKKLN